MQIRRAATAGVFAAFLGFSPVADAGTLGVFQSDANGFDTRTYYYDDGKEVTVFDTQFVPPLTVAMVDKIRSETASPITRVIVTHPNPDKFNGLSVLHALGAVSIGSQATADALPLVHDYKKSFWIGTMGAFTEATYPRLEPIRETFSGTMTIPLASGETITLFELKHSGVATTQTVARIDSTGDLIVGDLVHHHAHAWLEGGLVRGKPSPDLTSWIAALNELKALNGTSMHGGRGSDAPVAEAVSQQQDYLRIMDKLVGDYVRELGPRKEELRNPAAAKAHHAELQKRAVAAFPTYAAPYMVGFSVYGLAQSKL